MKKALWVMGILASASTSAFAVKVDKFQFKAGEIKSAVIHNSTGNVHIAPVTDQLAYVIVNKVKWGPRCHANVDLKEGELNVQMDDTAWILDHECRVDLIVSIPEKIPLQVRAGMGDVKVTGSREDIDVKVGSGLISLKGDIQNLKALSGSGDIKLEGLAQQADIKTGSGDIELDYRVAPSSGKLMVQTGTGDVQVYLPPGANVKSQITAGNGTVINEFTSAKDEALLQVDAASEAGDIQIRKK
jgi:DUF4097 and DUF4098 domain-containing protein YvlB